MNIQTRKLPNGEYEAIDDDSFDGPESPVGYGMTPEEAEDDLLDALEEGNVSSGFPNEPEDLRDVLADIGTVRLPSDLWGTGSFMREQGN